MQDGSCAAAGPAHQRRRTRHTDRMPPPTTRCADRFAAPTFLHLSVVPPRMACIPPPLSSTMNRMRGWRGLSIAWIVFAAGCDCAGAFPTYEDSGFADGSVLPDGRVIGRDSGVDAGPDCGDVRCR